MGTERRASRRVAIELWVQQLSGDRIVLHPAANLSEGGLFLFADPRDVTDDALLEFSLPGEGRATVRVHAKVAWTSREGGAPGVGVEFVDLDARARDAIADYLSGR